MVKPRIADLFCGAGGAGMGLHRAGFEVVGFDIKPQPRYPFEFHQADALTVDLSRFDAVWASPPCQLFSQATEDKYRVNHQDLIAPAREIISASRLPYIIENVPRAPLQNAVMVCGGGLLCFSGDMQLHRHRLFEANFLLLGMPCVSQKPKTITVAGHGTPTWAKQRLGRNPSIEEKREAMGIDWMNRDELSQAIPPAYSEFLGKQLIKALRW